MNSIHYYFIVLRWTSAPPVLDITWKKIRIIMAATELWCHLFGINPFQLTPQENLILEIELFNRIYEELMEMYKTKYKEYFLLIKINMDTVMHETNILRFVIDDIVISEDYSAEGLAYHMHIPEEVLSDLMSGKNKAPSLQLSRKIFDVHRTIRPDLYKEIVKKIIKKYLAIE
jgi:hypothetical protein